VTEKPAVNKVSRVVAEMSPFLVMDVLDRARARERSGVALTPGAHFGPHGEGFLRLSYAISLENLSEGLNRQARFLGEFPPAS
jgi:aspartate/methionine/tyrosine aminotransferase